MYYAKYVATTKRKPTQDGDGYQNIGSIIALNHKQELTMKFLKASLLLTILLSSTQTFSMSDEEWAYAIILFDQPGKQALSTLVLATQRATKPFSDEYLDFLSEFIWQYLKSSKENPEYERDTATRVNTGIRLTRMIYASNSPRHVTAMKQIMNIMRKYVRMKVEITSLVEETTALYQNGAAVLALLERNTAMYRP